MMLPRCPAAQGVPGILERPGWPPGHLTPEAQRAPGPPRRREKLGTSWARIKSGLSLYRGNIQT
eukprot:2975226-Pyramimonas_sp.AAC.1